MSEVYEAENTRLGSLHAIKLFTYEKDDPEVRERFLVEGRLLARFNHSRIVKVTDIGTIESTGMPYMVMDLIQDEHGMVRSLADIAPGSVDEETVGRWYDDIRDGLAYIHAQGVIHRDLKLQNVMIGSDGHAVLTDFGVSRVVGRENGGKTVVDAVQTLVKVREGRNLVMGSLGYMAPELEMGVEATPESDWYALGVIVYRLLTGTWCDARTDVADVLETFDSVWKRIIPKLLHSNPSGRQCLSYADEKRRSYERCELESEEALASAKARGRFARHMLRATAAIAIVLAGVLVYGMMLRGIERREMQLRERQLKGEVSARAAFACEFDSLFAIPPEAKSDQQDGDDGGMLVPSRDDVRLARIDLLVLTDSMFVRLRAGTITVDQAIAELERLRDAFADGAFDRWPNGYIQSGTDEVAAWLLDRAIGRLNELAEQ